MVGGMHDSLFTSFITLLQLAFLMQVIHVEVETKAVQLQKLSKGFVQLYGKVNYA